MALCMISQPATMPSDSPWPWHPHLRHCAAVCGWCQSGWRGQPGGVQSPLSQSGCQCWLHAGSGRSLCSCDPWKLTRAGESAQTETGRNKTWALSILDAHCHVVEFSYAETCISYCNVILIPILSVQPKAMFTSVVASMVPPYFSSSSTTLMRFFLHAMCSGVNPFCNTERERVSVFTKSVSFPSGCLFSHFLYLITFWNLTPTVYQATTPPMDSATELPHHLWIALCSLSGLPLTSALALGSHFLSSSSLAVLTLPQWAATWRGVR